MLITAYFEGYERDSSLDILLLVRTMLEFIVDECITDTRALLTTKLVSSSSDDISASFIIDFNLSESGLPDFKEADLGVV